MQRWASTVTIGALVALACDSQPPATGASAPEPAPEPASAPASAAVGDASTPSVAAPTLRPHGFAIVKSGATLRTGAGADAPGVRVASDTSGFVVATVGLQDGLVAVESADDPQVHCAGELAGVRDFRLRWLVAEDDLVAVTTRRIRVPFDDGTEVTLEPGVPVVADGEAWRADALGVRVRVPLPADAIDRFYERAQEPAPEPRDPVEPGLRTSGAPLAYDHGRALEGDGGLTTRYVDDKAWISAWAQRDRDGRRLVDVRARCAALTVVVPADRTPTTEELARSYAAVLGTSESGGVGLLGLLRGSGKRPAVWRVEAGKDVRWRDGAVAGLVATPHEFDTAPQAIDGRSCFAVAPAGSSATIELCFAAADVQAIAAVAAPAEELASPFGELAPTPGVRGSLDKAIIHRIARAHSREARDCYTRGLVKDPSLGGKVTIDFTIDGDGAVSTATVKDSTIADPRVGACIAKAVKRWKFPKPDGGGAVSVTYPFVLTSK